MMHFSDILKIDNMWNFVALTKLQMDNNIIEKIEGLEKLVNLEWLGNGKINMYITKEYINHNMISARK